MLLKDSVVVEYVRERVLRLTSRLQVVELVHDDINAFFVEMLSRNRDPESALIETGCSADFSRDFMAFLHKNVLLYAIPINADYIAAADAADLINNELNHWADILYFDPFWSTMENPTAATDLNTLYAWAIENYHHTHSVIRHLGAALSHTQNQLVADKLITHLSEEWDHPYLFKLSAIRFRRAHLLPALEETLLPLPCTQSLCALLQLAARRGCFAYKSCVAVLENTARRVNETRTFYRNIAERNALDYSVVEPFVIHAETDENYDHLNSLSQFSAHSPPLAVACVEEALGLAYRFAEALNLWQRHMMDLYLTRSLGEGHRTRQTA
ncbi:hypothetical protein PL78_11700 [Yersinia entomophaga]|uniref:Uncharacterized protein n=1 Tax=Yersinia entomophaga TaxID=935293 RepID=A0ABM6BM13_YERET|nr:MULTISPECIES: hypothetical protein [Yersinia]ANI30485.1 hypothetical protein PL78_11700 [Yersinia entomophaga]OWF87313.1 hypothetical protein B4914_11960 [Yersinia entomophaga]